MAANVQEEQVYFLIHCYGVEIHDFIGRPTQNSNEEFKRFINYIKDLLINQQHFIIDDCLDLTIQSHQDETIESASDLIDHIDSRDDKNNPLRLDIIFVPNKERSLHKKINYRFGYGFGNKEPIKIEYYFPQCDQIIVNFFYVNRNIKGIQCRYKNFSFVFHNGSDNNVITQHLSKDEMRIGVLIRETTFVGKLLYIDIKKGHGAVAGPYYSVETHQNQSMLFFFGDVKEKITKETWQKGVTMIKYRIEEPNDGKYQIRAIELERVIDNDNNNGNNSSNINSNNDDNVDTDMSPLFGHVSDKNDSNDNDRFDQRSKKKRRTDFNNNNNHNNNNQSNDKVGFGGGFGGFNNDNHSSHDLNEKFFASFNLNSNAFEPEQGRQAPPNSNNNDNNNKTHSKARIRHEGKKRIKSEKKSKIDSDKKGKKEKKYEKSGMKQHRRVYAQNRQGSGNGNSRSVSSHNQQHRHGLHGLHGLHGSRHHHHHHHRRVDRERGHKVSIWKELPPWLSNVDCKTYFDLKYNNIDFIGKIISIDKERNQLFSGFIEKPMAITKHMQAQTQTIPFYFKLFRDFESLYNNAFSISEETQVIFKIGEKYEYDEKFKRRFPKKFAYDIRLKYDKYKDLNINENDELKNIDYLRGIIIHAPNCDNNVIGHSNKLRFENDASNFGWIYCSKTNSTYVLKPTNQLFRKDSVVFFKPKMEEVNQKFGPKMFQNVAKMAETQLKKFDENEIKENMTFDGKSDINKKYYIRRTKINIGESTNVEFKHYRVLTDYGSFLLLLLDTIEKYCNAFYNTEGGTIYFGIQDDGMVMGTQPCNDEIIDFLQRAMASRFKLWHIYNHNINDFNNNNNYNNNSESLKQNLNNCIKIDSIPVIDEDGFVAPNTRVIRGIVELANNNNNNNEKVQFFDSYHSAWFRAGSSVEKLKRNHNYRRNNNNNNMNNNNGNNVNDKRVMNDINMDGNMDNDDNESGNDNDNDNDNDENEFKLGAFDARISEMKRQESLNMENKKVEKVKTFLIEMGWNKESVSKGKYDEKIEITLRSTDHNICEAVSILLDNEHAKSVEICNENETASDANAHSTSNPSSDMEISTSRDEEDDDDEEDEDDDDDDNDNDDDDDNGGDNKDGDIAIGDTKGDIIDIQKIEEKENDMIKINNNSQNNNNNNSNNNGQKPNKNVARCVVCKKAVKVSMYYVLKRCEHGYCLSCFENLMNNSTFIPTCSVPHCEYCITSKDFERIKSLLEPQRASQILQMLYHLEINES